MKNSSGNQVTKLTISELMAFLPEKQIMSNSDNLKIKGGIGDTGEDLIIMPPPPHR